MPWGWLPLSSPHGAGCRGCKWRVEQLVLLVTVATSGGWTAELHHGQDPPRVRRMGTRCRCRGCQSTDGLIALAASRRRSSTCLGRRGWPVPVPVAERAQRAVCFLMKIEATAWYVKYPFYVWHVDPYAFWAQMSIQRINNTSYLAEQICFLNPWQNHVTSFSPTYYLQM
jgi:hypothetical protein